MNFHQCSVRLWKGKISNAEAHACSALTSGARVWILRRQADAILRLLICRSCQLRVVCLGHPGASMLVSDSLDHAVRCMMCQSARPYLSTGHRQLICMSDKIDWLGPSNNIEVSTKSGQQHQDFIYRQGSAPYCGIHLG